MKKNILAIAFFTAVCTTALFAQTPDERSTDPVNPPADTVYRNNPPDGERKLEKNKATDPNRTSEANPTAPPRKNDEMMQKQKETGKATNKARIDSTSRTKSTSKKPQ